MMLNRFMDKNNIEAGVDEAGRGPMLGRVYTAAVILTPEEEDFNHALMRDSKKLSERKRFLWKYIEKSGPKHPWNVAGRPFGDA